jgi:hypothetical protein
MPEKKSKLKLVLYTSVSWLEDRIMNTSDEFKLLVVEKVNICWHYTKDIGRRTCKATIIIALE